MPYHSVKDVNFQVSLAPLNQTLKAPANPNSKEYKQNLEHIAKGFQDACTDYTLAEASIHGQDGVQKVGKDRDMPFDMVLAGEDFFSGDADKAKTQKAYRLSNLKGRTPRKFDPKDYDAADPKEIDPERKPHALCLTVFLSSKCFKRTNEEYQESEEDHKKKVDVKIDVFFNGDLCASTLVSRHLQSDNQRCTGHIIKFTGRRIGTAVENPWVYLPPGMKPNGEPNNSGAGDETAASRWEKSNCALKKQAEEIGKDDTKLGQYLSTITSFPMPPEVERMHQGSSTYGVIDVVVIAGRGWKDAAGGANIKVPKLLKLTKLAPKQEPNFATTENNPDQHPLPASAQPSFASTALPPSASTAHPTSTSTALSCSASTGQPSSASTDQPSSASTVQPTCSSTAQPTCSSTAQTTSSSIAQPTSSSIAQPISASAALPSSSSDPFSNSSTVDSDKMVRQRVSDETKQAMSHSERVRRRFEAPDNFAPETIQGFETRANRTRSGHRQAQSRVPAALQNAPTTAPAQTSVASTVATTAQQPQSSLPSTTNNTAPVQTSLASTASSGIQPQSSLSGATDNTAPTQTQASLGNTVSNTTQPLSSLPSTTTTAASAATATSASQPPAIASSSNTIYISGDESAPSSPHQVPGASLRPAGPTFHASTGGKSFTGSMPATTTAPARAPSPSYHPTTGSKSYTGPGAASTAPKPSLIVVLKANPKTTPEAEGPPAKRQRTTSPGRQADNTAHLVNLATAALERAFTPVLGEETGARATYAAPGEVRQARAERGGSFEEEEVVFGGRIVL